MTDCRCGGALEMRRKGSIGGTPKAVWQCTNERCWRVHGPVSARDLRDQRVNVESLPYAKHKRKPQPNSRTRAYQAALHSAHWRKLREKVLAERKRCERDGPGCTLVPTELNHLHYDTLGHETKADVEACCWTCNQTEREQRHARKVLGA